MGNIGDGAVVDFSVLTEGLPEEDGGRGVAIGHECDIHVDMIAQAVCWRKRNKHYYMTTIM
jgi:hypothetical protein